MLSSRSARARLLLPLLVACVVLGGCSTVAGSASAPAGTTGEQTLGGQVSGGSSSADGAQGDPAGGVGVDADAIDAARTGLANWLQDNRPATERTSTDIAGCPLLDLPVLQSAMAAQGVTEELQDWGTEIEWSQYTDLDPELMGVVCGADSDGDTHNTNIDVAGSVTALDLTDRATFDDLVGLYGLESDPAVDLTNLPAGRTAGACVEEGCLMFWGAGDGLVLGTFLIGVDGVDQATAAAVLDAIGPAMLSTMAEH